MDIFVRLGEFLYKSICKRKKISPRDIKVINDLKRLHPTETAESLHRKYYVEKWSLVLKVLAAGVGICILMLLNNAVNGGRLKELPRQVPGGGEQSFLLEAKVGEEKQQIVINVEERKLRQEDVEIMLQDCIEILVGQFQKGGVEEALPESIEGYPFEIMWRNTGPGEMCAYFYYGEEMYTHTFVTSVSQIGRESSMEERLLQKTERKNNTTRYKEAYILPEELDGVPVEWTMVREDYSRIVLLLVLLTTITVYFLKDKDLHDEWLKKRTHMKMSYPMVLDKFVLYMEAGLTVRGSFLRIAAEGKSSEKNLPDNAIYQEMLYSCHELNAGVSEHLVYENFGKRTGLEEYTRFATMLSQNLKKGNAALLTRLREEGRKAQAENIHLRIKLGEEAQTKLLLPMVLMMTVVMLLVMVPAFSSF